MGKANIATAKLWRLPSATARGPCLGSAAAPGLSPDTGGFPQGRLSGVLLQAVNRRSRCSSELGLGFLNYSKGKNRYREAVALGERHSARTLSRARGGPRAPPFLGPRSETRY